MLITPMARRDIPAYLRGFADWYAQALSDLGPDPVDDIQASVAAFMTPQLDADGVPQGSTIFDLHSEELGQNVGVLWAGGTEFGIGPLFYIHDLRIHPPFRRRGFARAALDTVYALTQERGGAVGIALSVMAGNAVARELYASNGFAPISEILVKRF